MSKIEKISIPDTVIWECTSLKSCLECEKLIWCNSKKVIRDNNEKPKWLLITLQSWIKTKIWIIIVLCWVAWWVWTYKFFDDVLLWLQEQENPKISSSIEWLKKLTEWNLNFILESDNKKKLEEIISKLEEVKRWDEKKELLFESIKALISILYVFLTTFWLLIYWKREIWISIIKSQNYDLWVAMMQLRTAFNEIEDALEKANSSNEAKEAFLANMAHELRTPLNAIMWYSDAILQQIAWSITPKQKEYLDIINSSWIHLLGIINDILEAARILKTWNIELNITPNIDVWEVINEVLGMLNMERINKKLDVIFVRWENVNLDCDRQKLKQTIINIVKNAIKFTKEWWKIRINVYQIDDEVIIEIIDSWIWIPKESIEKLCRPFEQVDNSLTRSIEWTWLWLYLSKTYIEAHEEGKFEISSEWEWRWTKITISLKK